MTCLLNITHGDSKFAQPIGKGRESSGDACVGMGSLANTESGGYKYVIQI